MDWFKQYTLILILSQWCLHGLAQHQPEHVVVAGVVTDSNGAELENVHVISKNRGTGTITNNKGYYKIEVTAPDTIVFMFMGMKNRNLVVGLATEPILFANVLLESYSVLLNEAKVSPFLSKKDLSYDNLPMDGIEAGNYELRQRALNTDKTRFSTFGFNFAPLLFSLFERKSPQPEESYERRLQLIEMKQKLFLKGDSAFKNSIPVDSMKHPSRSVFIKDK